MEPLYNLLMKQYLIEYVDGRTNAAMSKVVEAEDKTQARDMFFETHPQDILERITWVPKISN
jgi:hypothetical protein